MSKRLQPAWVVLAKATTDLLIFASAMLGGFVFRFGPSVPEEFLSVGLQVLPLALAAKIVIFAAFGTYGTLWRYSSLGDLFRLFQAATFSSARAFSGVR